MTCTGNIYNLSVVYNPVTFFRFDTSPLDGDYRVIDVDYDRYAVVYSCTQLLFLKFELGWILTRDQMVNQSLVSNGMLTKQHVSLVMELSRLKYHCLKA